jgi:excisionase family DNA binding protein
MNDENELLDIAAAAAFLHVSETSLRRWTNAGRLACLRIGQKRERRFRRADLLAFMERQPRRPAEGTTNGERGDLAAARAYELFPGGQSHLCCLYSTDEGLINLAAGFLQEGLREGSVCFVVATPKVRQEVVKRLQKKSKSSRATLDPDRLIASNYHATPREQWDYFETRIREATRSGARSFRVFGDMWEIRKRTSAADVLEYEEGYDQLIAKQFPVVTLCGYDVRKFEGVELLQALKGHPDIMRHPLDRFLA